MDNTDETTPDSSSDAATDSDDRQYGAFGHEAANDETAPVTTPEQDTSLLPADYAVPANTPAAISTAPDAARDFDPARLPNQTPSYFAPQQGTIDRTDPGSSDPKIGNVSQSDLLSIADAVQAESELVRMYPIAHDGTKMNALANRLAELSSRIIAIAKPDAPTPDNAASDEPADDGTPSIPNAPQGVVTSETAAL